MCNERDISYQAFWILTANSQLLVSEPVGTIAKEAKISVEVALYGLVSSLGGKISVLNGTTKHDRMVDDIASFEYLSHWISNQNNGLIFGEVQGPD